MTPFRNMNDELRRVGQVPNAVGVWLRRIFVDDWQLKSLALVIAFALWYSVTGQRAEDRVEKNFTDIRVQDHTSALRHITTASLHLSGTRSDLNNLRADEIQISLDAAPNGEPLPPRLISPVAANADIEIRSFTPTEYSSAR